MNKRPILKCTLAAACAATLITGASVVPADGWLTVGRQAALVSLGMDRPQKSAVLLEEWVNPTPTPETTTQPTVLPTVGGAQTKPAVTVAVPLEKAPVPAGGGTVQTKQLSAGSSFVQGVAIKNNSKAAVDIEAALKRTPSLFDKTETAPQVLIVHTHTTECYMERDDGTYGPNDATRTDDPEKNMVAVGEAVAAQLRMAGIGVIHDTVIHDKPYNGAYGHSKAAVQAMLKKYPSVRVMLDIHRDAIYPDDNTHIKPTVVIDGKKAAQVMIIVGMLDSKSVPNPHVQDNLAFGARLQQRLHTDHPGLMRPLNLANARYNQQLASGSLLLEMGSDANTLEEALYAAELVGRGLVQVLNECGG